MIPNEEDFKTIQETLYLQSIPGLVDDVKAGMQAPDEDFVTRDDLPW